MPKYSDNPIIEALFPIIDDSEFPTAFPTDLRIGTMAGNFLQDNYDASVTFWPGLSTVPEFAHFEEERTTGLELYTHGIFLCVDDVICNIHNSQIISILPSRYEEIVTYKKSKRDRAALGWAVGGVIGGAAGALSGIGSATKNVNMALININFWDIERRCAQSIFLEYKESELDVGKFISNWEKEKKINKSEQRLPKGNDKSGFNKNSGCLSLLILLILLSSFVVSCI